MDKLRKSRQGVPKGSVLAPLPFLIYINSITTHIPDSNAMFMDDIMDCATDREKEVALAKFQEAIDKIVDWRREFKMLGYGLSQAE